MFVLCHWDCSCSANHVNILFFKKMYIPVYYLATYLYLFLSPKSILFLNRLQETGRGSPSAAKDHGAQSSAGDAATLPRVVSLGWHCPASVRGPRRRTLDPRLADGCGAANGLSVLANEFMNEFMQRKKIEKRTECGRECGRKFRRECRRVDEIAE